MRYSRTGAIHGGTDLETAEETSLRKLAVLHVNTEVSICAYQGHRRDFLALAESIHSKLDELMCD